MWVIVYLVVPYFGHPYLAEVGNAEFKTKAACEQSFKSISERLAVRGGHCIEKEQPHD